jgi:hypothetical protein
MKEYLVTDLRYGGWELREMIDNPPCLYCRGHYVTFGLDGSLEIDLAGERDFFQVPGEVMSALVRAFAEYMTRRESK